MRWITNDWRLKLLAVALSVLMLGAVAFSQANSRTLQVTIYYNNLPAGLVLISPIDKIGVVASGQSDLISSLLAASIIATADLSHVKKGSAISVPIQVHPTDPRIAVQTPPPITVNADDIISKVLSVDVRTPNQAAGWAVTRAIAQCGLSTDPCSLTFVGPVSVATGLAAFVTVTDTIQALSTDSLNETVQFEQSGRLIDLSKLDTLPKITISPSTVTAHVEAKRGTASTQVTLVDATPTHSPPPGYRVTNIAVDPVSVLCTGLADAIARLTSITLPAVDLSTSTANITFKVQIPAPAGVACSAGFARVTYSISPNPNIQPSPTPT